LPLPTKNPNPVQRARIRAGLTQIELAQHPQVRLSPSTIRFAERGAATFRTLERIAAALGVPVEQLTDERAAT
jgi:transcriptional regulator with XRE-family HTH domain